MKRHTSNIMYGKATVRANQNDVLMCVRNCVARFMLMISKGGNVPIDNPGRLNMKKSLLAAPRIYVSNIRGITANAAAKNSNTTPTQRAMLQRSTSTCSQKVLSFSKLKYR